MNTSLYELPFENIASYLQSEGWALVSNNNIVYAFEGFEDAEGAPLEIILPKKEDAPDYSNYVRNSINLVSALTERAPEIIANEIKLYNRDVLMIGVDVSPVEYAAMQAPRIKGLIGYSANSERNVKPHFTQYSKAAQKMLEHFRLRQTHNGESAYRIESEVGELERYQMPMFPNRKPEFKLPLQRRVMERIATGLMTADMAAIEQNAQLLIDGYADGFNANMCDAVRKMSKQSPVPIQYSVKWSRKISASKGVKIVKNIQIERRHREYLKRASDKLKELKPEFQSIRGRVIALSSLGDPQSDDVDARSIIVLWEHGRGRPRRLQINLEKNDYVTAHKAHLDWATISVDGITLKRRSGWQLADPQEFKILR